MSQQQQPRTLTISTKPGLFSKDLQILDAGGAQLYDIKGCKSDHWTVISIFNPQRSASSSAADIHFHGRLSAEVTFPGGRPPVRLSLTGGMFDNGYSFPSGFVGGGGGGGGTMLRWSGGDTKRTLTVEKGASGGGDGGWIAKYDKAMFGNKATLEVADGGLAVGPLDEIVVTGVVVAEIVRRRKSTGI